MSFSASFAIEITTDAADFAAGVHGPSTLQICQALQYNWPIGTYFVRGLAGPATFSLTGPDAAHFSLAMNTAANGSCGLTLLSGDAPGHPNPSYSINLVATDHTTTYTLPITVNNGSAATPIVAVSGNTATDAPVQPVNYWGTVTVANLSPKFLLSKNINH